MPFRNHAGVACILPTLVIFCLACSIGLSAETSRIEPDCQARRILDQAKIQGGLIVHLGCGDGKLTAALGSDESYVVQGLEVDAGKVKLARAHIRSLGSYGRVSVTCWNGQSLPYADDLVNLIVAEDPGTVAMDEILRVLAPRGTAILKRGEEWTKRVKPWPDEIDEWSHYLHGADNNAVARDSKVSPPQHMQWVAGPAYARSHETNSGMAAMVSAGGRLFYIWDEVPTGLTDELFPDKWSLIARDAFNGTLLWKCPMPNWGWREWHAPSRWDDPRDRARMLRHLPPTTPRRLVAAGDRLYVTLGYQAPVTVLDAATGAVIREIDGTAWTDEILHTDGTLLLRVRVPDSPPEADVWDVMPNMQRGRVMAVDATDGRMLWQTEPDTMAPLTLAAQDNRVFYANYEQVVCLDRTSGRELWRSESVTTCLGHRATGGTLVAHDKVVLYASVPASGKDNSGQLRAFSIETGELLWTGPNYTGPGVTNPPDLFVVDDLIWLGETRVPVDVMETAMLRQGLDPGSGRVVREINVPKLTSPGHHYRCYRSKATERYLLMPKRGVEFLDLQGNDHMRNDWLRAPCIYGVLPANGMLYVAPHQCVCYPGVLLSNFNALSGVSGSEPTEVALQERLQPGLAYHEIRSASVRPEAHDLSATDDWPAYRRDSRRSGSTDGLVSEHLERRWEVSLAGNLTPPVVADGRLLLADKDTHTVHALNADDGRALWTYTAGGRIDSPPTVYGPLVLFGSADGWVYCLRAADGEEVWRFLAAPCDRRIAAFSQLESTWPVHGSVLVDNDATSATPRAVVYCTAGRSTFLDGGIRVWGLDPQSGDVLHQAHLSGPRPDPFEDTGTAGYMDGARSDILVTDGADIYMHQERFRGDLERIAAPMEDMGKENGGSRVFPAFGDRGAEGTHLITTRSFLDETYNEGKFWTYSDRWPGWDRKMRKVPCYGQLLVFDRRAVYGVHVFTDSIRVRRGFTPGDKGYRMFARDHGSDEDRWSVTVSVRVRAMVLAGDKVLVAGPPDVLDADDPLAAFEGRRGGKFWALSATDGRKLAQYELDFPPVLDGLIVARGNVYLTTKNGSVICFHAGDRAPANHDRVR